MAYYRYVSHRSKILPQHDSESWPSSCRPTRAASLNIEIIDYLEVGVTLTDIEGPRLRHNHLIIHVGSARWEQLRYECKNISQSASGGNQPENNRSRQRGIQSATQQILYLQIQGMPTYRILKRGYMDTLPRGKSLDDRTYELLRP